MAALKPEIFKDTQTLITLYQRNPAFRERFDLAVARNVNVTYKHRPLKLYFEVLASVNRAKFGGPYKEIRRLIRHDNEGLIKKVLTGITIADLHNLNTHAEKAEKAINSTTYPNEEVEKINKVEESSATPEQKQREHQKRLEETTYLHPVEKIPKPEEAEKAKEEEEKPAPGTTPEFKKSYQPASPEETARLKAAFEQPRREVPTTVLVGPSGEPIRNVYPEQPKAAPEEISEEGKGLKPPAVKVPSVRRVVTAREFVSSPTAFVRNIFKETGARTAAGRAVVASLGRGAIRAGASTVARVGAGLITRLGISTAISAALGSVTAGVGFIVGIIVTLAVTLITTFSNQLKSLFKQVLWITAGLILFVVFMFISNWGMKMNSLLPPYDIAYAEPVPSTSPSVSPSPSISPSVSPSLTPTPGADSASCPLQSSSGISCGSYGTNYSGCPGGHCSSSYNAGLPPSSQCSPADSRLPHSIDVAATAGTLVYLPTINGGSVAWTYIGANSVTGDAGGGLRFMFTAHVGDNDWLLYLTHVSPSQLSLSVGSAYQSGEAVATVYLNQVHINIGKKTPSDYDTVWINPELLGMCI